MKKFLLTVISGFICIQLSGCAGWTMRTSVSTEPRVDQEISGNRGFIFGKPTSPAKEPAFTERKMYTIEIEIPPSVEKKKAKVAKEEESMPQAEPKEDNDLWGNKGYISGGKYKK